MKAITLLLLIACGSKEPAPKNDFEAFERKYVRQERALVEGARRAGKDLGPPSKDYPAIYVGPSGVWIERKLVAKLDEIEAKQSELRTAIDMNEKTVKSKGWSGLAVTFDFDKEPAAVALSTLRLFAEKQDVFFMRTVVDSELPMKATDSLCIGPLYTTRTADDTVQLSVLLDTGRIWVGLSKVNEFQEIPDRAEDRDFEKLETTLKAHKASDFFVERNDLELAVTAGSALDVLAVVGTACKVGFPHVTLLTRNQLSANPAL